LQTAAIQLKVTCGF